MLRDGFEEDDDGSEAAQDGDVDSTKRTISVSDAESSSSERRRKAVLQKLEGDDTTLETGLKVSVMHNTLEVHCFIMHHCTYCLSMAAKCPHALYKNALATLSHGARSKRALTRGACSNFPGMLIEVGYTETLGCAPLCRLFTR